VPTIHDGMNNPVMGKWARLKVRLRLIEYAIRGWPIMHGWELDWRTYTLRAKHASYMVDDNHLIGNYAIGDQGGFKLTIEQAREKAQALLLAANEAESVGEDTVFFFIGTVGVDGETNEVEALKPEGER
jgi:hypothetical protein